MSEDEVNSISIDTEMSPIGDTSIELQTLPESPSVSASQSLGHDFLVSEPMLAGALAASPMPKSYWIVGNPNSAAAQLGRRDYAEQIVVNDSEKLSALRALPGARMVWIRDNCPCNEILKLISHMHELDAVELSYSSVTDAGLDELKRFPKLSYLNLRRTSITNRGIAKLKSLQAIEWLTIGDSAVNDDAGAELAKMTNLRRLWLCSDGIGFTDAILPPLTTLPALTELKLEGEGFTEDALPSLVKMKQLRTLILWNGAVTDDDKLLKEQLPSCHVSIN